MRTSKRQVRKGDRMARRRLYGEVRRAVQDFVVEELLLPDLRSILEDLRQVAQTADRAHRATSADALRAEVLSLKRGLLAMLGRLDVRIGQVNRELRSAIDVRKRLAALEARRVS